VSNQIKENALFIADAHYPHHGDEFLNILQKIENQIIKTPQLFLMGDIFDLLFGYNDYIKTFSQEGIELLQKLSEKIEIIYIEGNHDFCLKEIFPNIKIYSRDKQPVHFRLNNQDVYMSHGDKYQTGLGYNLYSKILRNRVTLTLLKPFEKEIIDHRIDKLKIKKICGDFKGYQKRFNDIISYYPKNALIIEGHFHQALTYKNYISLPSLACQQEVGVIKNSQLFFITI
jgi:UDP-2,3-diacylglucosamine hydrolase